MAKKNWLDWTCDVLLVVGGLNWGLVALFGWNLVEAVLGAIPVLVKLVYILVGLAALMGIYKWFK